MQVLFRYALAPCALDVASVVVLQPHASLAPALLEAAALLLPTLGYTLVVDAYVRWCFLHSHAPGGRT